MARVHDLGSSTGISAPDAGAVAAHYRWPVGDRPWVRSNFVTTLDGAVQGSDGRSGTINTDADHLVFDALRALSDVVVVGGNTVRQERYRAIELSTDQQGVRAAHGLAPEPPALMIISGSLDLPEDLADGGGRVVVITGRDADAGREAVLQGRGVEVHRTATSLVDPRQVVTLCRDHGWSRVLLEGGPTVHREFLAAELVDEICLSITPLTVSGDRLSITQGGPLQPPSGFAVTSILVIDDTVMGRWRRADPDLSP